MMVKSLFHVVFASNETFAYHVTAKKHELIHSISYACSEISRNKTLERSSQNSKISLLIRNDRVFMLKV